MSPDRIDIAILGATSHIAKGLICRLFREPAFRLHLFARSADAVQRFLAAEVPERWARYDIIQGYDGFGEYPLDVIVNCIGVGTERKLQGEYTRYFTVTEEYDNMVLRYMTSRRPEALYIGFSSGAVYGRSCSAPVSCETVNPVPVNHVTAQDYYGIARLNAEAKHRAHRELRIVDLRVFSYFSRYIDVTEGYFITDVMDCILNGQTLETSGVNIVRDYIHPDDLYALVRRCMDVGGINAAFDVASARPVEKREILEYFSSTYGLKYATRIARECASPTGSKNVYHPERQTADRIGFAPRYSSMETIVEEAGHILGSRHG